MSDDCQTDTEGLSESKCLELLRSNRRRTLLEQLADSSERAHSLESLATAVTQTEQPSDLGARPDRRVCLSLHHVHLPKLDAADVIDYDAGTNRVEYLGSQRIENLLDTVGQ